MVVIERVVILASAAAAAGCALWAHGGRSLFKVARAFIPELLVLVLIFRGGVCGLLIRHRYFVAELL